ncbi:MAG: hypothetical protein ABI988_14655, partial [Nitrospirota bacterium]
RHMLLYLLFPDFYERISSRRHKVALAGHFESYTGVEQQLQSIQVRPEQDSKRVHIDKQLLAIRRSLEASNPGQKIDFYQEPWDEWRNEDDPGEEAGKPGEDKPSAHQFWIEKTIVVGRPDRETGEHRLGIALWSPQKSQDGRDIYANMRNVRPGDVVLHLIDNSHFAGVSIVQSPCDDTFQGVEGTQWGTQPSYRISLSEYQPLVPPLSRKEVFECSGMAEELRRISKAQRGRGLFYTKDLDLNQGAYLTPAPQN